MTYPDLKESFADQFKPYEMFGCEMDTFFEGTLVRFRSVSNFLDLF